MSQTRQLYLMRHAKSSWKYPLEDLDRPLNQRGADDAPRMGERLARRQVSLDLIVTSHALRAVRTAVAVAQKLSLPHHRIQIQPRLYTESAEALIRLIHELESSLHCVMLIGHNPVMTALANQYAHTPIANIPTAGVVHLESDIDHWRDFTPQKARLVDLDYPKRLND